MKRYTIKTERLGIRNWDIVDLSAMSQLNQDEEVMEFFPTTYTKEETRGFIGRMQQHFEENGFCYFAVDRLDSGEFIGFIGMMTQNYLEDMPVFVDIGWRLKKSAWGFGFATEGAKACLKFGFEELNLEEIYSVASVINVKSTHVMKKIGMKRLRTFDHPKLVDFEKIKTCDLYVIKANAK